MGNIKILAIYHNAERCQRPIYFFGYLGRGKGSLLFEVPSLRDGRITTRKIDSHTLGQRHYFRPIFFVPSGLARGNQIFYPRLALRDEPSTTRNNWLTLLANYTHNIFGQHVAILRDVRLAFLGPQAKKVVSVHNWNTVGRSRTQIHSHTFAHKKSMGRLVPVGQAKWKLLELTLRDRKFHSF